MNFVNGRLGHGLYVCSRGNVRIGHGIAFIGAGNVDLALDPF